MSDIHGAEGIAPPTEREQDFLLDTAVFALLIIVAVSLTAYKLIKNPSDSHPLYTLQWVAVALLGAVPPLLALLRVKLPSVPPRTRNYVQYTAVLVVAGASLAILSANHERIFILLGAMQASIVLAILRPQSSRTAAVTATVCCIFAWASSLPLSYTPLYELLLGATPSSALAPICFVAAFAILWFHLRSEASAAIGRREYLWLFGFALVAFGWLALRTDHFGTDWIPYHRMYYVVPAEFVRQGHYLLWDVMSQYGLTSELLLAVIPSTSVWENLYLLQAVFLVAQAAMILVIFYLRDKSRFDVVLGFLIAAATVMSAQGTRFPFGPRLYPQGGLRFLFPAAVLFVAFLLYVSEDRSPAYRRKLRILGWLAWGASILWSFEDAVWTTLAWLSYLIATEALANPSWGSRIRGTIRVFAISLAAVVVQVALVDAFYFARLHHLPDWTGFFEFTSVYATDKFYHVPTDPSGPIWLILLLSGAILAPWLILAMKARASAVALLTGAWSLLLGTSVYYIGEPYDNHINALLPIYAMVFGLLLTVVRREFARSSIPWISLAAFVPAMAIAITTSFGAVGRAQPMKAPFLPGYNWNVLYDMPAIHGRLAAFIARLRIGAGDRVILPSSPGWVTVNNGMIVPIVEAPGGKRATLRSWALTSPSAASNMLYSLPHARQVVYEQRWNALERRGGWLITYRQSARCSSFDTAAHRTGRVYVDLPYRAVRCAIHLRNTP